MPSETPPAPELVVTNFHSRFTGVSATAEGVVSRQVSQFRLCLVGYPFTSGPAPVGFRDAIRLCRTPPRGRPFAVWHVRRNLEMASAIFARDVLRLPIRTLFTSAAQRLHSRVPRELISRMDAVVATTRVAAGYVPNLADVVPHGVDTTRFCPAEDVTAAWRATGFPGDYGIGIVGRIRPEKGTDLFVDAMIDVLPRRPGFTAVVIGRGMPSDAAFVARLRMKIDAAGLGDRFVFTGEVPPRAMPELIRSLRLLVAPARYEGYGMTPLEAMASGVPVVASRTGVYPEVIDGNVGDLVPIDDLPALNRSLLAATADVDRLRSMGASSRAIAESRLSLESEAAGYGRVIERMWRAGCVVRAA